MNVEKVVKPDGIMWICPDRAYPTKLLVNGLAVERKAKYLHRSNGLPAYIGLDEDEYYQFQAWYEYNKRHRWNGPSENNNTNNTAYWDIRGIMIDAETYFNFLDDNGIDINNLTDADKLLIVLSLTP